MSGTARPRNHLAGEKSLYLRQHAQNPVDWYPWGEEAFAKARNEDKPIFLSIGYSACHWCHVMAHESFEDDYVASILNRSFVSIKVDREERPDLDAIYMLACQMISGGGGWPLTIIATPEGRPFFAGTYFSKGGGAGSPGLVDILIQVDSKWKLDRPEIVKGADEIAKALEEFTSYREPGELDPRIEEKAFQAFMGAYDEQYGGFELAPKFPSPHRLVYLLRHWASTGEARSLDMVVHTLDKMREGGINDHVGYGFHRYSTDQKWLLPHFEKMLYDQALQALAYADAYAATGEERFKETARKTLAFVEREMTSPFGGFFSAIGADSEGEEGKYYEWQFDEVLSLLEAQDFAIFAEAFDLQKEGNFRDEASRRRTGKNILHLAKAPSQIAKEKGIEVVVISSILERGLAKLFAQRERRVPPDVDDKVLADWSGLMVSAFAYCARTFGDESLLRPARRGADFVLSQMTYGNGRLYHRHADGRAAVQGFVDDYAFMAWGLTELYLTTLNSRYLRSALELAETLIAHFWDKSQGGFYFTADDGEKLLVRSKDVHDGAMPSGNAMAACLFERLSRLTGEPRYADFARDTIKTFAVDLNTNPMAHAQMLQAQEALSNVGPTVVIVGDIEDDRTKELLGALSGSYRPNMLVILQDSEQTAELTGTKELDRLEGMATAYVLRGDQVSEGYPDPEGLKRALQGHR